MDWKQFCNTIGIDLSQAQAIILKNKFQDDAKPIEVAKTIIWEYYQNNERVIKPLFKPEKHSIIFLNKDIIPMVPFLDAYDYVDRQASIQFN